MNGPAYEYRATVRRVVDGDTLDLDIDLGFECRLVTRARLVGINTPEVVGATKAAGLAAVAFVHQWLALSAEPEVLVRSYKAKQREKYGRWLVEVFRYGVPVTLNAALLAHGHATLMNDKGGSV